MNEARFATTRFVLHSYPAREEVEEFASAHGWPRVADKGTTTGTPGAADTELNWSVPGGGLLQYVEDPMTENCFVVAKSGTRAEVQRLGDLILEELFPWELPELIWAVDHAPSSLEIGFFVIRLGLAAPPQRDDAILERMQSALAHDDDRVRDMALLATTYSPWPEYVARLKQMAESDPAPRLRERSRAVLNAYEAQGITEDQ